MGIVVEHGPSMTSVGRLAYKTGQNEYINRRRRELEAQQEKRAERQQRAAMHIDDINAGFQKMQFDHQAGMQRQMMANQFDVDRDQKMHDWQVDQNAIDHDRRVDLMDMGHKNNLDELKNRFELEDKQTADNIRRDQAAQARNNLYGTLTPQGKDAHDQISGQIAELDTAMQNGEINQEQYDEAVAPLKDKQEGILNSPLDSENKRGARYQDGYVGKENGYIIERINGQDVYRWDAEGEDGVKYKNVAEWQEAHTKTEEDGDNIFKIIPDPSGGPPQRIQIQSAKDVADAKHDAEQLRIQTEKETRENEKQASDDARELYEKYTNKGDIVSGGYNSSIPKWALGPDGEVDYDAILAHERNRYGLEVAPGSAMGSPSAANVLDGVEQDGVVPFDQRSEVEQENIMMTADQEAARDPNMLLGTHPQGPNIPGVGSEGRPFENQEDAEHGDYTRRPDGAIDRLDVPVQPPSGPIPLSKGRLDLNHKNLSVAKDIAKQMGNMLDPEMIQGMSKERMAKVIKAYNNSLKELESLGSTAGEDELIAMQGQVLEGARHIGVPKNSTPEISKSGQAMWRSPDGRLFTVDGKIIKGADGEPISVPPEPLGATELMVDDVIRGAPMKPVDTLTPEELKAAQELEEKIFKMGPNPFE